MCSRSFRKESADIEAQTAEAAAMRRRLSARSRASRLLSLVLPGSHAFLEGRPVAGAATLFLFFLGVAAAVIDLQYFNPLALPPPQGVRLTLVLGGVLAAVVWLRAQLVGRRAGGA